uniref:Uncharacterized protein n=1 Tax=Bubo bubo TaxID=30461 RepID=A0A8C0ENZ1_BUBBB
AITGNICSVEVLNVLICVFCFLLSSLKMAELFMECEEEELEPWQKRVKEVEEDDDDDEPIFVGEISGSKPAMINVKIVESALLSKRLINSFIPCKIKSFFHEVL